MDLKTIAIGYIMASLIGALIYVPLMAIGSVVVAKMKAKPWKSYLGHGIGLGILIGSAQGMTVIKNDMAKYEEKKRIEQGNANQMPINGNRTQIEKRMMEIVRIVFDAPEKAKELRPEFYSLLVKVTGGDQERMDVLKFNAATGNRIYKEWVFKDALDSYRLGRVIKSASRQKIEDSLMKNDPTEKEQIDLDNGFIAIVANKEAITVGEHSVKYDEEGLKELAHKSRLKWSAVESLFVER